MTLLFTDIEGSTRLLAELGAAYDRVLAGYYEILREEVTAAGGREVGTEGDGYFAVLDSARAGVAAAARVQRRLAERDWPAGGTVRARVGLHTGEAADGQGGPVGMDVHRAARVAAAGHGGQVLVSDAVRVLVEHHLPDGVGLADLGVHRLKDLPEPVRLHQLRIAGLPDSFPPLRSAQEAPHNLPLRLTTFVGRDADLGRVRECLGTARLVTLTGPGGTGKTRLALEAAASLAGEYADGVWFTELAPIRDAELVPATILRALRVPEAPTRALREQLLDHVADRELLLVLDNFEQVLDAAPFVSDLLRAGPGLRALVTSRAALHLSGEQELPVPPLGLPDEAGSRSALALSRSEAVTLFERRAAAVRPGFAVTDDNAAAISELVRRLDGLPLAIELAAARVKLLSPEAMLERLEGRHGGLGVGPRDLPQRQQTLRDTIAWSYDLLGDGERRLLAHLAVFVDGWTLERAEEVCRAGIDVLDGISTLVDHSLVRRRDGAGPEPRFDLLETIRDFALEQLDALPEAEAVRERHAGAFRALAEEASECLHGEQQAAWIATLEREHPNLRAALDWFRASGDGASALRMGGTLWRFWQKSSVEEGQRRVARLLAEAGPDAAPELRSVGLEAAGGLAYWRGDMGAALRSYDEALAIAHEVGDPVGIANAMHNLTLPRIFSDGPAVAWDVAQEALRLFEAAGDERGMVKARWGAGCVAYFDGRYEDAERELTASLAAAEEIGDLFHAHWARHMLGATYVHVGRLAEARRMATTALRAFHAMGDHSAIPLLLDDFSALAGAEGDAERQARLAAASHALQQRSGVELARISAEFEERLPVDPAAFAAAWKEGLDMDEAEAVAYALADTPAPADAPPA